MVFFTGLELYVVFVVKFCVLAPNLAGGFHSPACEEQVPVPLGCDEVSNICPSSSKSRSWWV